jgi:hypothetical protein
MALRVRKIPGLTAVNALLRGGVSGSSVLTGQYENLFLNGRTIIFTAPAVTVTFNSGNDQVPLTLKAAMGQLAAALPTLDVTLENGMLCFVEKTPTTGVAYTGAGTANPFFGLSLTGDTGVVYGAAGEVAPAFVNISPMSLSDNVFLLVTDEA